MRMRMWPVKIQKKFQCQLQHWHRDCEISWTWDSGDRVAPCGAPVSQEAKEMYDISCIQCPECRALAQKVSPMEILWQWRLRDPDNPARVGPIEPHARAGRPGLRATKALCGAE